MEGVAPVAIAQKSGDRKSYEDESCEEGVPYWSKSSDIVPFDIPSDRTNKNLAKKEIMGLQPRMSMPQIGRPVASRGGFPPGT